MEDSKIVVTMVCKCGQEACIETARQSDKYAIVIYDQTVYICTKCGKEMTRRVVKVETAQTETIISEGN